MTEVYITSESGELVAEVNGKKVYELRDTIARYNLGFDYSIDVDFDVEAYGNGVWTLVDAIIGAIEEEP